MIVNNTHSYKRTINLISNIHLYPWLRKHIKLNTGYYIVNMWLLLLLTLSANAKSDESCDNDSDCPSMNYCSDGDCVHKDLFP